MYMKPTLPASGALCDIQAPAHSIAFLSMHIGSGPGVVGLSGMHVQPFVPSRSVRILPSALMSITVAFFAIDIGAADIALAISAASSDFGASTADAAATQRRRSEEHTSELQSRGLISSAAFC